MTQLLHRAFAKVSKLSKVDQNTYARWILGELASEGRWEKLFAGSEKSLVKLAEEALQERRQRNTRTLFPRPA